MDIGGVRCQTKSPPSLGSMNVFVKEVTNSDEHEWGGTYVANVVPAATVNADSTVTEADAEWYVCFTHRFCLVNVNLGDGNSGGIPFVWW